MTKSSYDIIVVGAGIIGAACAFELANQGCSVLVIDAQLGGATNAGMGHLVVMDDNPAELTLSGQSMPVWYEWVQQMKRDSSSFQYTQCGTMWIASNAEEMAEAERKQRIMQAYGVSCELLNGNELAAAEPALRTGLAGGLKVSGDGLVYAPDAAEWLLMHANHRIERETALVISVDNHGVVLADGTRRNAQAIVLAAGLNTATLCPEIPMEPKKGHLAITDRYPHYIHHQLVELGYVTRAHMSEGTSVAFNAQPRPTGQILLGSSRQFDSSDCAVDLPVLAQMLAAAIDFLPGIKNFNIVRAWTGFRPASKDGQPFIGRHPWWNNIWLATGHEGLGVTTAPATAKLLTALMMNSALPFDAQLYSPDRLSGKEAVI